MDQLELRLLARMEGAAVVPPSLLQGITTYRQAVRLCWALRRVKGMRPADLAAHCGLVRQHVSDYLNPDDARGRRDLPAEAIEDVEDFCGNTAITQFLASRARLTVIEEMQAARHAA